MRTTGLTCTAVVFVSLALWSGMGFAQESHVGNLTGNAKRGKALYVRYCVFCHGPEGDGRGESAPYLDPKPRDFARNMMSWVLPQRALAIRPYTAV